MSMFDSIKNFENLISNFYGSQYAVSTDCCTHAIELCLRLQDIKKTGCPKHTYASIPMTFIKLNLDWQWKDEAWRDFYYLSNTNIIDAAVLWKKNSYIPGTMMCLSFQFKKHLGLGRGGMILLDDKLSYNELIKMSYDGRTRDKPWSEQDLTSIGYHYYMTPETADQGIDKFSKVKELPSKTWDYTNYPDLSSMAVFKNVK